MKYRIYYSDSDMDYEVLAKVKLLGGMRGRSSGTNMMTNERDMEIFLPVSQFENLKDELGSKLLHYESIIE